MPSVTWPSRSWRAAHWRGWLRALAATGGGAWPAFITTSTLSTGSHFYLRPVTGNGPRAPDSVWTPLTPSTMPADRVSGFGQNTPLGRPAQPAEVAPAYVLLASDEASYVSTACVPVTGGRAII